MKLIRSTKCSLKFATKSKIEELQTILTEYGKVCNVFIKYFWENGNLPSKSELLKDIVDLPNDTLTKNIRRSIGIWNWKYWLKRLEMACELNRVKFRTVAPFYTSTTCPKCGYSDRMNRNLEVFRCLKCSHEDNADLNASLNILLRFITGLYGACCKPEEVMIFNLGKIS